MFLGIIYSVCWRNGFVVIEELLLESNCEKKTDICTVGFAIDFALMMTLDVALG